MPRLRAIQAAEASMWLGLWFYVQKPALLDLLGIAHDVTAYPDDISGWRLAELLLR